MIAKSRWRFCSNFLAQKARRVPGTLNRLQSCPCQKQPCICTAIRYLGNTRSGRPAIRPAEPKTDSRFGAVRSPEFLPLLSGPSVARSDAGPSSGCGSADLTTSGNFPLPGQSEQILLDDARTRNPRQHGARSELRRSQDHHGVAELPVGLRVGHRECGTAVRRSKPISRAHSRGVRRRGFPVPA